VLRFPSALDDFHETVLTSTANVAKLL